MNIEQQSTTNFWSGRSQKISAIVLHWWGAPASRPTLDGVLSYHKNPATQLSAHYYVQAPRVVQLVKESDTAWHARQANPFTIGIEIDPNATEETYKLVGQLVKEIRGRHGNLPLKRHSDYVVTSCPGTIDFGKVEQYAGGGVSTPSVPPATVPTQPATTNPTGSIVHLPATAVSWKVYPLNKAPVIGNQIGTLAPQRYGGLSYAVLGTPQANVVTIQTQSFGRVNIYVAPETGATFSGSAQAPVAPRAQTVFLPASAPTWRLYNEGGPYTVGSEKGLLTPARFGGLSYTVLGSPVKDVVVIQTQSYGRGAIYVAPGTGAVVK